MKLLRAVGVATFLLLAAPGYGQDPTAVWNTLSQPVFDASKTANVSNLMLARDRIHIVLANGAIQFTQPANGVVFGAVFRGEGRLQMQPPNLLEARQLYLYTNQTSLDWEFTEATFSFSDDTFQEVSGKVQWGGGGALNAEVYANRQKEREDMGAETLPRLFKGVLSGDRKRTAFFAADLKTKEKGWVHVRFDALEPEEISLGRWTNWGGVTLFDTWMSFPAGDKSASEAYKEPLAKEDFLIRRYKINATATAGAELNAISEVHFEQRAGGERVLVFALDANLRAESVRDAQGNALTFFQPREPKDRNQSYGDYVVIVLSQPTAAGQSQTLEFKYGGKRVVRKEGNGNYFCPSSGWYPTRPNSFASRADFEINFRSPKRFTLVATGNKISESNDGDWTISTWKSDIPLAVTGFAYGDYKIHKEKAGEIDVEIYANKEGDDVMKSVQRDLDPTLPQQLGTGSLAGSAVGELTPARLAKPMAIEIGNTLRVFEKYFGPYPYKRLAVTSLPLSYSYGQGWPTLIYLWSLSFLDSQQRHTLGIRDQVAMTDTFRAHESSHQWWGHRVGWKSYHDQWLSEGFAEFSGNLYAQFRQGEKEYTNRLRQDREYLQVRGDLKNRLMESLGPIWMGRRLSSSDSPGAYSFVIYAKGGYVLHMIRMMLYNSRDAQNPEARFIAMMHDFTRTYDNKPASTEDFKAILEKYMSPAMDLHGNKRVDWFFNQYVYGTGIPKYQFQYKVEPGADGKFMVSGTLTRSGVPEGWKDALPIYLQSGGRTVRLGWITANQQVTPFSFPLPMNPEKLVLNANEDILAEIKQ